MTLIDKERETYETMWGIPNYDESSPGARVLPVFLDMATPNMRGSILDAGCGSGKGALALRAVGFDVCMCDLTNAGLVEDARDLSFTEIALWADLKKKIGFVDWVYCCDVLEHIPPSFSMLVVARMLEIARKGVFLSITFTPDEFGAWVGKPLHQTLQTYVVWKEQLASIGRVKESRDLINCGMFLVEPC